MYKFHPQFLALERMIAEGAVGEVKTVSIKFGIPPLAAETFRNNPQLGGGALLDLSCYLLSAAYRLLPERPDLRCAGITTQPRSLTDTDGWAVLESRGAVVDCEWGTGRAYQNTLRVWGTSGVIVCDRVFSKEEDWESTLELVDQRGTQIRLIRAGRANAHQAMIEAFASNLHQPEFFHREREETTWCAMMTDKISSLGMPRSVVAVPQTTD